MRPKSQIPCAQFGMDFDYDVGVIRLTLHGELDALSVPAFAGALNALADRNVRSVTIDLSELRFCNIGGLRAMAELAARLNAIDGRVEIVAPAILTRLLELSDLRSLFAIAAPGAVATGADLDPIVNRGWASRPRAGAAHRLPTSA